MEKLMPKLTPETTSARKTQILLAALACFSDGGYTRTTMDEIVRQAGLSKGSIYTYFDSKKSLYLTLLEKLLSDTGLITALGSPSLSSRQRLAAAMDNMIAFTTTPAYREYAAFLMDAWTMSQVNPDIRQKLTVNYSQLRDAFQQLIQSAIDKGEFIDVNAAALAQVFIAIFDGLMVQFILDPDAVDWKLAAATIQRSWMDGLSTNKQS